MSLPDEDMGLEDAIGAALDEQLAPASERHEEKPEASGKADNPFPKAEELRAKEGAKDDAPKEYVREGRRFVLKNGKETEVKEGEAEKETPVAAAKEWKPLWYKEEFGEWGKLHPDLRKALEEREREVQRGMSESGRQIKAWEPVTKLLEPHIQELRAAGLEPQQYVANLIEADKYLRADPVQALNWLCQTYVGQGWDIRALAEWMDQQGVQTAKVDPVKQELETLKQKLAQLEQAPVKQQREMVVQQINDFANATDESGALRHPYFAEVRPLMASLAQASPQTPLSELYTQAVWASPILRERMLAAQRKSEVERARSNSLGTREQTHSNGQLKSTPTMSLEEEIGSLIDGMI